MTHDPETGEVLDAMADVERRIGIVPLSELLPERAKLVEKVAPLRALYGSFGTAEAFRKAELAKIRAIIRAQITRDGKKLTNDQIDDAAHASGSYVDFIVKQTQERGQWIVVEGKIAAIDFTINRGQMIGRFASAETYLTPRAG